MSKRRIKTFGGQQATYPIKDLKMLQRVIDYLKKEIKEAKSPIKEQQAYRNYILILTGFNTAFRAEDLLQLRVSDVISGAISIKENKTKKMQVFELNKEFHEELLKYVVKYKLKDDDYLFMGQKKVSTYNGVTTEVLYPIIRQQARIICLKVKKACGITFKFGMHSLRKTFGYHYMNNGGNILTLQKMYNHSDPSVTILYTMWATDDIEKERRDIFIGGK